MIYISYFLFLIGGVDRKGKTVNNIGDLPPQAQEVFARRGELDDLRKSRRVSKNWHSSQLIDNKRTLTRPSGPAPAPPLTTLAQPTVPPLSVSGPPLPKTSGIIAYVRQRVLKGGGNSQRKS